MRTIIYLLLLFPFLGCKKDNSPESQLTGTWLFKEGKYGTSSGSIQVVKAHPDHPIRLTLKKEGIFSIDNKPSYYSGLQENLLNFNRYQLLADNQIRFYNSSTSEEVMYNIELKNGLRLYYKGCREGCSDFFIKSY